MAGLLEIFQPISLNFFLILASIFLFVCYYLQNKANYWSKRGVPGVSMATSFLGWFQFMIRTKQMMSFLDDQYKKLAGYKYGGTFQMTQPALLVCDPEVIRLVLVKGFTNFHDRLPEPDEKYDPLSKNLFELTGEKWHQVRQKLSPAFSSAKLKIMYQNLQNCAQNLNAYLQNLSSETGYAEIDVKELVSNYTLDVIGACAMGLDCDAIKNPDSEFKRIFRNSVKPSLEQNIAFILTMVHPKIPRWLGLRLRPIELDEFLIAVCRKAMEMKSDESSKRTDFLQILMNLRDSEKEKIAESTEESEGGVFTENLLMGVIVTFLSAGFEPVAVALTFCLYELALHPEFQEKIFEEIQTVKKEAGDDISYEDLKKLQFLDQIINETLRKYPVAGFLIRICTEPFQIPDSSYVVEKGVRVFLPVYSLHRNPKYFPNPEKFDPERFSKENIDKIVPGTYMPFGDGPRFCIAMRFALMDIKTMVTTIVSNYILHACNRTLKLMEFDQSSPFLSPKGGLWLRLQKRK